MMIYGKCKNLEQRNIGEN